jgi:hypothetical protein
MAERNSEPIQEITAKTLQVKWTDIEIKKYRLNDESVEYTSDRHASNQIYSNPAESELSN